MEEVLGTSHLGNHDQSWFSDMCPCLDSYFIDTITVAPLWHVSAQVTITLCGIESKHADEGEKSCTLKKRPTQQVGSE